MSKIVLTDVSSGFQLSKINENFQKIEDELNNKVLYRDAPTGEPNALENDLDANGKSLYNIGDISLLGHDGFEEILAETEDARDAAISAATDAQNEAISAAASAVASGASAGESSGFASDAEISALSAAASAITAAAAGVGALAVSSGAALVGFTQSGTGAVAQTVRDKLSEFVSVKDFGAVGGADDTAALQAAINASAGKTLFFPAGTFVASALTVPHSMSFAGEGSASIIKQKAGSNANFIEPSADGVEIVFSDLTLDQNNAGQTAGSGKFIFNTVRAGVAGSPHAVEFRSVTFKDFCEGAIRMVGDRSASTRESLKVLNCKFRGGTESESGVYNTFTIFAADACELVVEGCDFDHGMTISKQGIPAISVAGTVTPSAEYTEVTIRNNRFKNYGRFTAGSGVGVIDCYVWADKVDISGNKFIGSYTAPIRGKTNARNVVVHGNIMSDFNNPGTASMSGGISFVSATLAPTSGKYIISDNIISGTYYRGIEVSDGVANPESVIISGNIIDAVADIGIYLLGCKNFAVESNNIKGTGQQGIAFSTCLGIGRIERNIVDTTALTGIQAIGSQLSLDVQVHGNFVQSATLTGITCENVRTLSLQENIVKDVVLSGSQRGYRVGGSTGIAVGQIKNNLALGTFATAQYSVITAGFTTAVYERGNSWNYSETYAPTAPIAGTWARGDVVWNTAPAAGGTPGWVCTTAGTPGTWKAMANLAA